MSTQVIPFAQAPVPAYISQVFAPEETNITTAVPLPTLSFRGKTWRIGLDGTETVVMNKDNEPASTVTVVVLDQIKARSRVYYEGQYVAGENKPPRCSSIDGIKPDADVAEPCAATCASCPNSVKGSKVSPSGHPTTACSATKRLAVVPASAPEFKALLLRLPQTSLWDKENKENEAKGWYAWDQYMDFLKARGVTHTAQVVTKVKFDHRTEYPKLLFSATQWVDGEKLPGLRDRAMSDEVRDLLFGRVDAPPTDDVPATGAQAAAPVQEQAPAQAQPAAPTRTRAPRTAAAKPAAPPPAQEQAPAPAAAASGEDDGEDEGMIVTPAAQAAATATAAASTPAAAAPAATAGANPQLASLLGNWDD